MEGKVLSEEELAKISGGATSVYNVKSGDTCESIAKYLGKSPKQIDNTIQRIRAKLKKFFI